MRATTPLLPAGLERPGVRVRTLVGLRWIAIVGQLAALAAVGLWMGFPMPTGSALTAIAASAALNLGLIALYPRHARLEGGEALAHLTFDLVQLAVLLFLTGGLANPFSVLLLVPVTIGATLLATPAIAALLALAVALLVTLWSLALPLPWAGDAMALPAVYRFGLLLALALGMLFLAVYAGRVSAEGRRRAAALIATQTALEREGKMAALGSLAAAAAHELGGPLGTIILVARNLEEQLGNDPDFGDDIRLLNQEANRSRDILVRIARRAEAEEPFATLPLAVLLHEVAHGFEASGKAIAVDAPPLAVRRTPELLHGLSNIVANAVRHAESRVTLTAAVDTRDVLVTIADDGAGFDPELLPRLGEPDLGPSRSGSGGTGLGIFIATEAIERTGGRIAFANAPDGGARVDIRWPRTHIEAIEPTGEDRHGKRPG